MPLAYYSWLAIRNNNHHQPVQLEAPQPILPTRSSSKCLLSHGCAPEGLNGSALVAAICRDAMDGGWSAWPCLAKINMDSPIYKNLPGTTVIHWPCLFRTYAHWWPRFVCHILLPLLAAPSPSATDCSAVHTLGKSGCHQRGHHCLRLQKDSLWTFVCTCNGRS